MSGHANIYCDQMMKNELVICEIVNVLKDIEVEINLIRCIN